MNSRLQQLAALLDRAEPRDGDEVAHLSRMRQLCDVSIAASRVPPRASPDPCARDHFVPGHFTASAFILSPQRDALLLIFHGKLARWLQPGGHVDALDRDLLEAARREAREEVGLSELELLLPAPFDLDVHQIPALRGEPAHAHFDVRFLFRAKSLEARAASDAKALRWVPLAEIDVELSDRSVMRAVEKLRG